MSGLGGGWYVFRSRGERTTARGEALARLAGLIERGVPLPVALSAVREGLSGAVRRRLANAAALAQEGQPLLGSLLSGGLVEPEEQALLQALTGADPAHTLRALAHELRGRGQLELEIERGLRAPLRHALGLAMVLAMFGVVGGVGVEAIQRLLGTSRSGGGAWAPTLALLLPLLAWGWFEQIGLARLTRSRWLDELAGSLPAFQRLLAMYTASTFLRRLGLCLAAGRPLPVALEASGAGFGGRAVAAESLALARRAREGAGLTQCLGEASFLDPSAELLAHAASQREDPPRELLALAQVYANDLALEARGLGPVLGGCLELAVLFPLGTFLGRMLAGLSDAFAMGRMMF